MSLKFAFGWQTGEFYSFSQQLNKHQSEWSSLLCGAPPAGRFTEQKVRKKLKPLWRRSQSLTFGVQQGFQILKCLSVMKPEVRPTVRAKAGFHYSEPERSQLTDACDGHLPGE